jgi:hypothetical protein
VLVVISPSLVFAASTAFAQALVGLSGVAAAAVALLACEMSRDAGRRIQPGLWEHWGGPPTSTRLQYRGGQAAESVERIHTQIETVIGRPLPTRKEEEADNDSADIAYEDAIAELRELTRDPKRFALVFKENIHYGFRRNLLGLRPIGVVVAAVALAGSGVYGLVSSGPSGTRVLTAVVPGGWSILMLAIFIVAVNETWVRLPADAYADRLLGTLALLVQDHTS